MNAKQCTKCAKTKPLEDFYKHGVRTYHGACKDCIRHKSRRYRIDHPEKYKATQQEHYRKNKDEICAKNKAYREANPEKARFYHTRYMKERRQVDPNFKLITNLRGRIHAALRGRDKSQTTRILLGCTPTYLKEYLESRFTDGMTWDNYGKWHVDHIEPCDSFDFTKEAAQRACFHYTNLQPLWAKDNIRKGNKKS